MANDLSDLDHASPASGDLVSLGDDAIRETRQKLKNWAAQDLGNTNAEHYNTGPHRFPSGDGTPPGFVGLPAIGNVGRIAVDTTNGHILRDNGSTWRILRTTQPYVVTAAGPIALSTSYVTLVTASGVIMHSGALAYIEWTSAHTPGQLSQQFQTEVQVNGSVVSLFPSIYNGARVEGGLNTVTHSGYFHWSGAFTVGSNTFTLRGRVSTGTPGSAINAMLRILVL